LKFFIITLPSSQEKEKWDEEEVVKVSVHDEVPLAILQPEPKPKPSFEGTPRKVKRMSSILKAILTPTQTEEPSKSKPTPSSLKNKSVPGADNTRTKTTQKMDFIES
jgi:hypothetical protein